MTQNSARIFNGFQQSKFMRIHSLSILPAVLLCFLVPGMSSAEAEAGSASLSNPLCEGIEGFGLERCLELADVAGMLLVTSLICMCTHDCMTHTHVANEAQHSQGYPQIRWLCHQSP